MLLGSTEQQCFQTHHYLLSIATSYNIQLPCEMWPSTLSAALCPVLMANCSWLIVLNELERLCADFHMGAKEALDLSYSLLYCQCVSGKE